MLIPQARTYPLKKAGPELQAAFLALGLQAKNVANTACFIIRNILTSYGNGVLKGKLTENQTRTLDLANEAVKQINDAREIKHIIATANGEEHKLKLLAYFAQQANPWQILDVTLVDTLTRTHPNQGINPYTALPSAIAQAAVNQTLRDFKSYRKALTAYLRNPEKFTGRPQMPNYHGKNEQAAFQIPLAAISTKGKLPKITDKEIASDNAGKKLIGAAEKLAYHGLDLNEEIKTLREKLGLPENSKPAVLRISFKKEKPEAAIVFTYDQEVPDDSLLARVLTQINQAKPDGKPAKPDDNQKIATTLQSMTAEQVGKFSGVDLGLNNFLTQVFSDSSSKNQILSNQRLETKINLFNAKYDNHLGQLIPDELKELQKKESLSKAENIRKKQLFKIVYADATLREIQAKRDFWTKDYLTKIAHGLVKSLVEAQTELMIVGLNQLWKQESDMGKTQNRRFHNTAHTQFIQILRHQCTKANIVLVTTEESYTSKTSFANNAPLKTHANVKQKKGAEIPDTQLPPPPATGNPGKSGSRSKTNRHCFTNHPHPNSQFKNWKKRVHADINGAFNIARKMFSWFKMNDAIQFSYTLLWLSPKSGLTPMRS